MKYILSVLSIFLFFTGCQNSNVETPNLKTYSSFDKFDYSKENINFFEKEFENISSIENIKILKEYQKFYTKNSNYFLNGKQKIAILSNKIYGLEKIVDTNSDVILLEKAKIVPKKEAIKIYKELAKKNNIKAQRELVEIYKLTSPEESLKWLEKLVEEDDIHSMKEYASANIYMVRPIIVQDLEKALITYEELAKKGELSSMMRLGNIYEYGYHKEVAKQDKEKALEYYESAADKGYLIAQKKLYKIYTCEKCKPNRYDQKKAEKLQKILVKNLDKDISLERERKATKKTKKGIVELTKVEKVKNNSNQEDKKPVGVISKKTKDPKLATVKCYDMKKAKVVLTKNCKKNINLVLKENKNISKINITAILDKEDIAYYKNKIPNTKFQKSLLKALANDRLFETVWHLQRKLKDDSIINISTYFVNSKNKNRGIILKFY